MHDCSLQQLVQNMRSCAETQDSVPVVVGALKEVLVSTEEPVATVGWPEGQPLYWTSYFPDAREVLATVRDRHQAHLFTVIRDRRDPAGEVMGTNDGADPMIMREVIRRLEQEDWEMNAVYRVD